MRSLRIAICSSGEPVSDLWARLLEMICCLRSVASAISRVTAPCLLFISIYYTYRIPQDGMLEVGYWRPGARGRESRPVEQRTQLGMPPFVLSRIGGNWLGSAKRLTIRNRRKRSGSAPQQLACFPSLWFSLFC